MAVVHHDHDYCSTTGPAAPDPALKHTKDLRTEIVRLKKQIQDVTLWNTFGLERFAGSDDDIRFYTR